MRARTQIEDRRQMNEPYTTDLINYQHKYVYPNGRLDSVLPNYSFSLT